MINGSRMPLRILHTSDLHLESLDDPACHSLKAMVDLAIKTRVDLAIIAGDLFDHARVDDNLVSFVADQLRRLSVYVAILPGNHDCIVPGSAFDRASLWQGCANARLIRSPHGETLNPPGLGISIWGKAICSYEDDARPLAGVPQGESKDRWRIAVAHGHYADNESEFMRSFCITPQEIATSCQDYVALGHWPLFRCVCTEPVKAYYSGSASLSGMVAIIDLAEESGVQVTPCSLPK